MAPVDIFAGVEPDRRRPPAKFNDIYTPPCITRLPLPYIDPAWRLWECCWGRGHMADELVRNGYDVAGGPGQDCFEHVHRHEYDCIVTNPPYSNDIRIRIIEMCVATGKPWALLLRNEHLGGIATRRVLKGVRVEALIPDRRVNFITPSGIISSNTFNTFWLCHGLNLPLPITFAEYVRD